MFSLSSFGYNILLLKKKFSDSLVLQTCKCSINKSLIDYDDKLVSGLFTLSSCSPGSVCPESVCHYYSSPYTLFTPYRYPVCPNVYFLKYLLIFKSFSILFYCKQCLLSFNKNRIYYLALNVYIRCNWFHHYG